MSAPGEVSNSLKVRIASILAALRSGTIMRAPGVTSEQFRVLQENIEAAHALLSEEFSRDNLLPFIARPLTTPPKLPPGNPAAAAISLASAITFLSQAHRHFEASPPRPEDGVAVCVMSIARDELFRFTAQMDNDLRERVCAVLEGLVNYRGLNSLAPDEAPSTGESA